MMAKQRRNIRHNHPPNPGSWLLAYWHPPGQFLCQLMVFQVLLQPLDNDCLPGWTQTGENRKNKWLKQYAMIIIAHCRQKCRNQNWRYSHQNNHFVLNIDFCRLFFIFFRNHCNFQGFQRPFQGYQQFQGFSGISGVASHPVHARDLKNVSLQTWKNRIGKKLA